MIRDKLQNRISGSDVTLPVCAVVAAVLWWFPGKAATPTFDVSHVVSLAISALITYLLVDLNNRYNLLRVRSQMVASTWLIMVGTIITVHPYSHGLTAALFVTIAYYLLFFTFQNDESPVSTFHWAFMLTIGSMFMPQVFLFFPFFLWHQAVFLRSMTLRTFSAALIGFIFPMLLWVGFWTLRGDYSVLLSWWTDLTTFGPVGTENYHLFTVQQVASWGLVTFLAVISMLHYLCTSFNDKIQTRMFYYILVFQFVVIETLIVIQPQDLDTLMPLLMVTSAPLVAHFFTFTGSWFTNTIFKLSILAFIGLAYLNFWMPIRFM